MVITGADALSGAEGRGLRVASGVSAADYAGAAPYFIIGAVVGLVTTGLICSCMGSCCLGSPQASRPAKKIPANGRNMLAWLGLCVGASCVLLLVQCVLGYLTLALTVAAGVGHGAADAVMYLFAYLVESGKLHAGLSERAVAVLDATAGCFTILVVVGTTALVMAAAVQQLEGGAEEERELVSPALLSFSCLTVATGCALLWVQRRWSGPGAKEGAEGEEARPVACAPSKGPDGCDRPPQGMGGISKELSSALRGSLRPCGSSVREPSPLFTALEDAPLDRPRDKAWSGINLNVSGAMLHVAADVLRTLVTLSSGTLVVSGAVSRRGNADAICSLAVGVCVLVGGILLLNFAFTACVARSSEG